MTAAGPGSRRQAPVAAPLLALFIAALAWTSLWTFKATWGDWRDALATTGLKEAFFQAIPHPVRILIADLCWITADEYIHFGGSPKLGQKFLAGSFAGNTEILPLLQLAVRLDPTFFDVYQILSHNLAMYLDRFQDAIRLLQEGIRKNRTDPRLHELYGTIAYSYCFIDKYAAHTPRNPVAALRYLDAALEAHAARGATTTVNPPLAPRFYHMVRARLLVEQGKPAEALAAWRASGDPLETSDDLLGIYLARFARGEPVPPLPEDLPEGRAAKSAVTSEVLLPPPGCGHDHSDHDATTAKKDGPLPARGNPVMNRLLGQTVFYGLGAWVLSFRRRRFRSLSAKEVRPST